MAEGIDVAQRLRAIATLDRESRERWQAVGELQRRADRATFEVVRELARSGAIRDRVLALDVLGQFGYAAQRPFLDDTLPVVIGACDDDDVTVLDAAIVALGHLADQRGQQAVLDKLDHPSPIVRLAVAFAIPSLAGNPPSPASVDALIRLSCDPDGDVRDWATMGLGSQFDTDTGEVRDALAARLHDEYGDTAGEALLGLARRHDARALPELLARLDDNAGNLIIEAAAELGAPSARSSLERLKAAGWDHDGDADLLNRAIAASSVEPHDE